MASFLPRYADIPAEVEAGKRCRCTPWPCTPDTCSWLSCDACAHHGRPLHTQAETTWLETGEGLPKETAEDLAKLSQPHGPNSRAARQRATEEDGAPVTTTYTAGTFGDSPQPETVPGSLALVCVSCGQEVELVTSDDLAAMEALPAHDCPNDKESAA